MPTLLRWNYSGVKSERHGEQCAYAGDRVLAEDSDDEQDLGTIDRLDGAAAYVELPNMLRPGDKMVRSFDACKVYAVTNREDRHQRAATGRSGAGHVGTIGSMLGLATGGASTSAEGSSSGNRRGKPFSRARGSSALPQPKRKEPAAQSAAPEAAPSALIQLGAEYADSDDEASPEGAAAKRAKAVQVRQMSAEERAAYKRERYLAQQNKNQIEWFAEFKAWLAKDALRGAHCKLCILSSIKPADKLSSTGYGFVGEGADKVMAPIPTRQKLQEHESRQQHQYNVRVAAEMASGKSQAAVTGCVSRYVTITPEDELYFRTIRTVHLICRRQLSLNDMASLLELQSANGMVISFDHSNSSGGVENAGLATWLLAGANVFRSQQRERAQPPIMRVLFPKGVPFGFLGDGSNDRALCEQEAVVLRFMGADGMPFNTFYDLAELDLTKSADGLSPDATCIAACYDNSLSALNEHDGFLWLSDWKKASVGASFDGASVMLGSQNGAAKKLKDMAETHLTVVHAVAHVEQLANADSFGAVEYYDEWRGIVQEVYVHYNGSGKKRHGLEVVASHLSEEILKIRTTHGIRWAASQEATIKALTQDLPSIVVDLEVTVKSELGLNYTQLTPSNSFLGKSYMATFAARDGATARQSRWKAMVKSFQVSHHPASTLPYGCSPHATTKHTGCAIAR